MNDVRCTMHNAGFPLLYLAWAWTLAQNREQKKDQWTADWTICRACLDVCDVH